MDASFNIHGRDSVVATYNSVFRDAIRMQPNLYPKTHAHTFFWIPFRLCTRHMDISYISTVHGYFARRLSRDRKTCLRTGIFCASSGIRATYAVWLRKPSIRSGAKIVNVKSNGNAGCRSKGFVRGRGGEIELEGTGEKGATYTKRFYVIKGRRCPLPGVHPLDRVVTVEIQSPCPEILGESTGFRAKRPSNGIAIDFPSPSKPAGG